MNYYQIIMVDNNNLRKEKMLFIVKTYKFMAYNLYFKNIK